MRMTLGLLAVLLLTSTSFSCFKYERELQALTSTGQHYAVVDETIWQHAGPNLGDLRIFENQTEIPYVLTIESGESETEQKECRVLQPGTLDSKTQFLLDMSSLSEYDRVELKLKTKNFVARARVEGQDDAHGRKWTDLGTTTLYDLSNEKLGHNYVLQIPLTTYRFLRVTVDNLVKPSDIEGGTAGVKLEHKAVWRDTGAEVSQTQDGKDTVLTFPIPRNIPVERLVVTVDEPQQNFMRRMEIQNEKNEWLGAGEISRIHMQRNGQMIDTERMSIDLRGENQGTLKAIVHNEDDLPLRITSARLQQYERRFYFQADSGRKLTVYYGDSQLRAPVYDYAKLFQEDAKADQVQMEPEVVNAVYTGRPDDRPWSERHPAILWAAIVGAVLLLGGVALRSMKAATT